MDDEKKERVIKINSREGQWSNNLHRVGDGLSVGEYLVEVMRAEHVPQRRLRQQARAVVSILHVGHRDGGVVDAVVDHGVHRNGHRVLVEEGIY